MFSRYAMAHGFSHLARRPREACINEVATDRVIGPAIFLAIIIGWSVRTIQGRKILANLQEPSVQIRSAVLGIIVVDTVLPVGLPVIPCQKLFRIARSSRWIEDKNVEAHSMHLIFIGPLNEGSEKILRLAALGCQLKIPDLKIALDLHIVTGTLGTRLSHKASA